MSQAIDSFAVTVSTAPAFEIVPPVLPTSQEESSPQEHAPPVTVAAKKKSTRKRKHDQESSTSGVAAEDINTSPQLNTVTIPLEPTETTIVPPPIVPSPIVPSPQSVLLPSNQTEPETEMETTEESEEVIFYLPPVATIKPEEKENVDLPNSLLDRYMPYAPEFLTAVKNIGNIIDVFRGPPPNERKIKNSIVVDRAFYINCDMMKSKWLIWIYSKVYEVINEDDISLLMERK